MSPISSPARALDVRPGVCAAAHVLQGQGLKILRVHTGMPALILVDRGVKSVCTHNGVTVCAQRGQAIILSGNQTVDIENTVLEGTHFEACWLLFDPALLQDACYRDAIAKCNAAERGYPSAQLLPHVCGALAEAFYSDNKPCGPASYFNKTSTASYPASAQLTVEQVLGKEVAAKSRR